MNMKKIDTALLEELLDTARATERKRINHDLRTSCADTSQRMLNAMQPGTLVPIHRHEETAETVFCLSGRIDEIQYDQAPDGTFVETERVQLCPAEGIFGVQIPLGVWHTVEVHEPTVIFEAKDGPFKPRQ
jgi:hypothetical protein